MTDIGERIKLLREEQELTLDMLVADLNTKFPEQITNKSMISRWENKKNEPTLENAKILSMYFNVSVDFLLGLTDVRTPSRLLAMRKKESPTG